MTREMQILYAFPLGEQVVEMKSSDGRLFVKTNVCVYEWLDGKMIPVPVGATERTH